MNLQENIHRIKEVMGLISENESTTLEELNNTPADIKVNKGAMSDVTNIYYSLGGATAEVKYFGDDEIMGIELELPWKTKEFYLERIDRKHDAIKGIGLILLKNIFEHAKRNKINIITLKRDEFSGPKLHEYYKKLGFVGGNEDNPNDMYLDLRSDEPLKKINELINELINN